MVSTLDIFYSASPIWLQNIAISAYGLRLRSLRFGASYHRELEFLQSSQFWSRAALQELQNRRLSDLLTIAFTHVPYYRTLAKLHGLSEKKIDIGNLALLPTLPKEKVRAEPLQFIAELPDNSQTTTIYTSGTSGSPLPVKTTRQSIQKNYAFFARYLGWHGVYPHDHGATFAGRLVVPQTQSRPPFWRHNYAMDTLLCSSYHLSDRWMPTYVQALSEFQPHFIDSYPSAISSIAAYINGTSIPHHIAPKTIITSSETLLASQRQAIETAFSCKIRDHYGCAEMAALITECEHGSYHVNPEFGIAEILRDDGSPCEVGEVGQLCCTGFLNSTMPLIRYMIGDSAQFGTESCACGRAFPVIKNLLGRIDDVIVTPDGRKVGRLDPAFKMGAGIVEAQIIQEAIDRVEVLIVADNTFDAAAAERLHADLEQRLSPQMTISIRKVLKIPRQSNGKFRAVVSKIAKSHSGGNVEF